MDRSGEVDHWVHVIDSLAWALTPEQCQRHESSFVDCLSALHVPPKAILAELPDESLALLVQKGFFLDQSFEELFVNRYSQPLAAWFTRWGAEQDRLDDLAQQLYLAFFRRRLRSYQPDRTFRSYLRRSARNLWLAETRRSRPTQPLDPGSEPLLETTPEDIALAKELERRLEAAVCRLPEEQQRVLRETLEGKHAETIAQEMNRSKQAVFMLLFRARRGVAQALGLAHSNGESLGQSE